MDLPIVNRSAVILVAKVAFLEWVNSCPDSNPPLKLEDLNREPTVYLIPEQEGEPDDWLEGNYMTLFEEEFGGWYTDESLWPEERTYAEFRKFFEIRVSSLVVDAASGPIVTDEILLNEPGEIVH